MVYEGSIWFVWGWWILAGTRLSESSRHIRLHSGPRQFLIRVSRLGSTSEGYWLVHVYVMSSKFSLTLIILNWYIIRLSPHNRSIASLRSPAFKDGLLHLALDVWWGGCDLISPYLRSPLCTAFFSLSSMLHLQVGFLFYLLQRAIKVCFWRGSFVMALLNLRLMIVWVMLKGFTAKVGYYYSPFYWVGGFASQHVLAILAM